MKFAIDLSKVQDLKPIPAGIYIMKILDIDATKKSRTGNEKLVIKSEILAPQSVATEQKHFWFSLSLVESALFRLKQLMEASGIPIKSGGFDTADLIGRETGITVTLEDSKEYGLRNQVVGYSPSKQTKPELKPVVATTTAIK